MIWRKKLYICNSQGVLAQLVERLNGIQKVSGSIPLCSTKNSRLRPAIFCWSKYTLRGRTPSNSPESAFGLRQSFCLSNSSTVNPPCTPRGLRGDPLRHPQHFQPTAATGNLEQQENIRKIILYLRYETEKGAEETADYGGGLYAGTEEGGKA